MGTQSAYQAAVRSAQAFFGPDCILDDVNKRGPLMEWQSHLAKRYCAKTANYYVENVHLILEEAHQLGKLKSSPIKRLPKLRKHDPTDVVKTLSPDQAYEVLCMAYERSPVFGAMLEILGRTAFRFGEVAALEKSDINWEYDVIYVVRSVYHGRVTATKSRRQGEWVPMSPLCKEALLTHLHGSGDSKYVFPNAAGGPMDYANFYNREYKPFMKSIGYEGHKGLRLWRHSFATTLMRHGKDLKLVARFLRHRDCRLTLEQYSHVPTDALHKDIEVIDEAIPSPRKQPRKPLRRVV